MSERALALAEALERANNELIAVVERCSGPQWRARCAREGWSAGVAAHHIAVDHPLIAGLVQTVARGESVPQLTWDWINGFNAQHEAEHANCTKEETVELLRQNGAAAASIVRELTDEQLDRTASIPWEDWPPVSAQQLIERKLIGHISEHLESIRTAISGGAVGERSRA
jgi:hypothetical protein